MRKTAFVPVFILAACSPAAAEPPVSGIGKAIDGDSLTVGQTEVRLFGIDAPEFVQTCKRGGQDWPCGSEAADRLSKLVNGKQVRCISIDTDEHGRTVARCSVGGVEINRQMVVSGYATAYRRYSLDYISAEDSAKASKRGIWSGTFQMPSDVRHADDRPSARPVTQSRQMPVVSNIRSKPQPSGNCRIKGNRGRNGRIYHVPGQQYYGRTVAEEIFCSEGEARAAGYRRSKV